MVVKKQLAKNAYWFCAIHSNDPSLVTIRVWLVLLNCVLCLVKWVQAEKIGKINF